jgi:hypothetical protein
MGPSPRGQVILANPIDQVATASEASKRDGIGFVKNNNRVKLMAI